MSVGCFCIKNIYSMLRLQLASRVVHQVVTWKTAKTESLGPKAPVWTDGQQGPSVSKEPWVLWCKFP